MIILFSSVILFYLLRTLKKSEKNIKQYDHLLDQNIMMATLDTSLKIVSVSSSLARHLKYTKEELTSFSESFIYQDCEESLKDEIKLSIQSGETWSGEVKKLSKTDEIKWMYVRIQPMLDETFRITGYKNIFQDISTKKKIEDLSNLDSLTDLYNRRFFDNTFKNQIKIAKRNNNLLAFAMIDIDHFKKYNDFYGHKAGDDTLKDVAYILKYSLKRPDDYVFRLGGEEFGMLFKVKNKEYAYEVARKTVENIEAKKLEHVDSETSNFVTISMGLYIIELDDINDVAVIYEMADRLLYKAKQNGRNQVVISE